MCDKLNLDAIRNIPPEDFKEILQSWMDQKEITQTLQMKLRKQLVNDFQKTELAKRLEAESQKNLFSSKEYVIDTLQAEHLYHHNNHFTLSVFFTETRHSTLLPNFEKENSFRFEKNEIQNLIEMLGLARTDKLTRRILSAYKSSNESLLSVVLKELIHSRNSTETRNFATQTEPTRQSPLMDVSTISSKSKTKRSKRKNRATRASQEFKVKKPKKLKEVKLITQSLEKMSSNISVITNKLDEFRTSPSQDESKTIIGHVATIMNQLNGCVSNFESLCRDIKQINETRNRNYDEWMDDLQNSDNGRHFLRKLQKSFSRVMNEEKSKIQRDFRKKLEREKAKLAKHHRSSTNTLKVIDKKPASSAENITKEIKEIFENTCMLIKNVEKENDMFEKSLEIEFQALPTVKPVRKESNITNKPKHFSEKKLNLNERRQIHSAEGSSDPSYGSKSFEEDASDANN